MITVSILINGNPIFTRSARNTAIEDDCGNYKYAVDDGSEVWHDSDDGAVVLAKKLLDSIKDEAFK